MSKTQIVTPVMTLQWAKVFEPEDPMEPGKSREWSIEGLIAQDDPALLPFITRLETEFQTLNGAGAKVDKNGWPFGEQIGKETNKPTGMLRFRFKRKETSNRGNTLPPPVVVDAKRTPWPADTLIGNGSKGKVAFDPYGWDSPTARGAKGMSLWLNMLQVIELVPYARATPEDTFEEEEGTTFATTTPFADEKPMSESEKLRLKFGNPPSEPDDDSDIPF